MENCCPKLELSVPGDGYFSMKYLIFFCIILMNMTQRCRVICGILNQEVKAI